MTRRRLLVARACALILLLLPQTTAAQIAFDAAVDGGNNSGATNSLTFSHTVTGTLPILFACVVGDTIGGADDITGVTYNTVAMTLADKFTAALASNNRYAYLYWLIAPATGAHNVVVTSTGTHFLLAGAASYTGAKATGQLDAHSATDSGGAASTLTSSLTTIADNAWTVLCEEGTSAGGDPTAGTGLTRRAAEGSFSTWGLFDSNGVVHPAGSYSMRTDRVAGAAYISHLKASIVPDTGGAATVVRGPLVGIGP